MTINIMFKVLQSAITVGLTLMQNEILKNNINCKFLSMRIK